MISNQTNAIPVATRPWAAPCTLAPMSLYVDGTTVSTSGTAAARPHVAAFDKSFRGTPAWSPPV